MSDLTAQDLYREMMNGFIAPVLRKVGFKRKGQSFEKQRHGYDGYVGFHKNRWNTKSQVSFTINLSVVNAEIVEEQILARQRALELWGPQSATHPPLRTMGWPHWALPRSGRYLVEL